MCRDVLEHQTAELTTIRISHGMRRGLASLPRMLCLSNILKQVLEINLVARFADEVLISSGHLG
jgi:hypothetical protein